MKVNIKGMALMAALAAGVAGAQTTGTTVVANPNGYTTAGTGITNTASATFTDPTGASGTATSNTVTTTVLPLPSFDIVYDSGEADGSTKNAANSATGSTPDLLENVKPGDTKTDTYDLVNNGNTPLVVHIVPVVTGGVTATYAFPSGTTVTTNGDGSYDVTLPVNSIIKFTQSTVVPTTAAAGSYVGASPAGTATAAANPNAGIPAGTTTLQENQTVSGTTVSGPAAGTDLQYQALHIYTATLTNNPQTPDGTNPVTTTVTPPGTTTPVPGYNAPAPVNPPGGGTTPGTTPITESLSGKQQIAYPPADPNATPDVVAFTNTVTNSGSLPDTVTLAPVNGTSTWTKTGTGTYTDQNGVIVQFIDPATGALTDTVVAPAATGTTPGVVNYTTQVTYPDSNTVTNPKPINVIIGATSGNNPNIAAATTTDTVLPPAATFGDTAAIAQTPGVVESPATAYGPSNSNPAVATAPGATATFPMSISNSGTYADSYKLQGYVVIPNADGTSTTVPVTYTQADGTVLQSTGSTTVNGVTVPIYNTAVIAANGTQNFTASVVVPSTAAYTGTAAAPALQQTATGVASTIVQTDTNDVLPVGAAGNVFVGKFANTGTATPGANAQAVTDAKGTIVASAPTGNQVGNPAGYDGINAVKYAPQVQYDYMIIAKNSYNSPVTGFVLKDTLSSSLQFQSATCNVYDAKGTLVSSTAVTGIAVGTTGATVACPSVTLMPNGSGETLQIFVKIQ